MKKILIAVLTFAISVTVLNKDAKADWYQSFMQVTCVKNIGYFSIKSFGIPNGELEAEEQGEKSNGIYTTKELLKKPYTCQLNGQTVTVELQNHTPPHSGACGGIDSAVFSIKVDGEEAAKIGSSEGCTRTTQSEVVIGIGGGKQCISTFENSWPKPDEFGFSSIPTKCKTFAFKLRDKK